MADYLMELKPNLGQQIAELELRMRQQVYPKLIDGKKLNRKTADWQVKCMEAAVATLKELKAAEVRPGTQET